MKGVVLVDDHVLLRNGLAGLVENFGDYKVLFQADNGKQFIEGMQQHAAPDIVLMDINMPVMDGYQTSLWLKEHHPQVHVIALSMYDDDTAIIKMFKAGAKGYILKDCEPSELKTALHSVATKGFYYSDMVTGKLIHTINSSDDDGNQSGDTVRLTQREIEFLKLACSEYTYKEIADQMFVSPRTVDGYRADLFQKLDVKTRVGLVMYAIKNRVVTF